MWVPHHPILALAVNLNLGALWIGLAAYAVNLNLGALWIGLAPTIAVITSYVLSRRKIQDVHTLVNNRSEQQDERIAQLQAEILALKASGAHRESEA